MFAKKIKTFKGFVFEKEDVESEAGGYQHLEKGVGLGYIKLDVSEKLADDKMLQSCLLKDLISNVEYLYKELRNSFDDYISGAFDPKKYNADELGQTRDKWIAVILKRYKDEPMKGFDKILWRIEIDAENIEDLINHVSGRHE